MNQNVKNKPQEFLEHWCRLSEVQKRALLALANEMDVASRLVETSMEDISARFLSLCQQVDNHQASLRHDETNLLVSFKKDVDHLKNAGVLDDEMGKRMEDACHRMGEMHKRLDKGVQDCEAMREQYMAIVTKMQFQDRTSQRLSVIGDALKALGAMMTEMESETLRSVTLELEKDKEDDWIKDLVAQMHLGEIRERFIKHALFDKSGQLFDGAENKGEEVDYSEASDDIELF